MIYRVTVKTTNSVQPGNGTFWNTSVAYCGASLEEARIAFLASRPSDYWTGYGNRGRETVIAEFESEPNHIDDESAHDICQCPTCDEMLENCTCDDCTD